MDCKPHMHINKNRKNSNLNYETIFETTIKLADFNCNLIRIVFSFLSLDNKRKIYFSNKYLRKFLECKDISCFHIDKLGYVGSVDYKNFRLHKNSNNILCSNQTEISLLDTRQLKLTKLYDLKGFRKCIEHRDFLYCILNYSLIKFSIDFFLYPTFLTSNRDLSSICKISEQQFALAYLRNKIQICTFDPFEIILEIGLKNTQIKNLFCFNSSLLIFSNHTNMITILKLNQQNKKQLIKKQKSPKNFLYLNKEYFACTMDKYVSIFYVNKLDKVKYSHRINSNSYYIKIDLIFEEYIVICGAQENILEVWDWKNKFCLNKINLIENMMLKDVIVDLNNVIICSEIDKIHIYKVKN